MTIVCYNPHFDVAVHSNPHLVRHAAAPDVASSSINLDTARHEITLNKKKIHEEILPIILEKEPYYEQKTCHLLHEEIPPINKRTIAAVFRDSRSMN
jgi:hypothetical protein